MTFFHQTVENFLETEAEPSEALGSRGFLGTHQLDISLGYDRNKVNTLKG